MRYKVKLSSKWLAIKATLVEWLKDSDSIWAIEDDPEGFILHGEARMKDGILALPGMTDWEFIGHNMIGEIEIPLESWPLSSHLKSGIVKTRFLQEDGDKAVIEIIFARDKPVDNPGEIKFL